MGGFYGSVQVKTADAGRIVAAVEEVAREKGIKCLVGPVLRGWVGIYPERGGQDDSVGAAVAKRMGGAVMHLLVHDDDVMAYWLWREGELVDSYWSWPGYFGEEQRAEQEKMKGDARVVAEVCGVDEGKVREVLEGEHRAFEVDRLEHFGRLSGMANLVTSYEYLKQGESEGVEGWEAFVEVPGDVMAQEKTRRKQAEQSLAEGKARLKSEGLLLAEVEREERHVAFCGAPGGFLLMESDLRGGVVEVMRFAGPWRGEKLPWKLKGSAFSIEWGGGRLALGIGADVVMDGETGSVLLKPSGDQGGGILSISADGERVAGSTKEEVMVTEVGSGKKVLAIAKEEVRGATLDRSGKWLFVKQKNGEERIYEVGKAEPARVFWPGGKAPDIAQSLLGSQIAGMDMAEVEKQQKETMERMLGEFEKVKGRAQFTPEMIEKAKKMIAMQWEQQRETIRQIKTGTFKQPERAAEQLYALAISRDERWMWTATAKGLKVFAFNEVLATTGDLPRARWEYRPMDAEHRGNAGHVYAVEEIGGGRVIFSGSSGRVWVGNLEGGNVREVLTIPGGGMAHRLAVSVEEDYVATLSRVVNERGARNRSHRQLWQVWDLKKLMGRVGAE